MERKDFAWLFNQVVYIEKRVRSSAWPEGQYVYLVPGSQFTVNRPPLLGILPEGTDVTYQKHIDICYGDGTFGVWTPSQADLFRTDYDIV